MARSGHTIEKLIDLVAENAAKGSGVQFLFGAAAPGGDTGEQDDAPIGSIYARTDGKLYTKLADANSTADWEEKTGASVSNLNWRPEVVRASTGDTLSAGAGQDPTSWTDNESGVDATNWNVGDYVLGDVDGTPALWEITAKVSGTSITLAAAGTAIAANDTFVTQAHLPDSPGAQEQQAILHSPDGSSALVKIGDVNWDVATGINLSGGYAAANGSLSSSDTVESGMQKLDGNQQDIQTASGLTQGDTDYGTFTGDIFADAQTSKQLFQKTEDELEQLTTKEVTGLTAIATVDEVNVDAVCSCKWLVCAFEEATPVNKESFEVYAMHNGTSGADATATDDTVYGKLKTGANFNLDISTDVNGTGAAQTMRLRATSSTAGVTITARRITVEEP